MRVGDAAEERLNRGEVDRNNFGGDLAVRLTMNLRRGRGIRRVNQAEPGAALGIKPIGQIFDPVLVLDFEVLAMRFGDVSPP